MRAVSDADFYNAMKRTLSSPIASRRLGKILAASTLVLSLAATFSVHSAIRILGPVEESPPPSAVTPLSQTTQAPSTVNRRQSVGPTRDNDTLWSIATRYQPNNAVTVYQTLGAIFRLNPNAFEDQNIHGLVPGSTLMMPTLTEIRRESTDDVAQRLQIDQARKDAQRGVSRQPLSQQVSAPVATPRPAQKPVASEEKAPKPAAEMMPADAEMAQSESLPEAEMKAKEAAGSDTTPPKPDMGAVQNQINQSDLQMGKLVESNHILKIRLAEVQNELVALKDQMSADEELTEEIKSFLEAQRMRQAQMEMKEPSFMESLMASPLMLATVAIIPALLVIGAAAFIIMRRRKDDDDVPEPEGLDGADPDMNVIMVPDVEDDDELVLEDDELEVTDDTDADDLFGDDGIFDSELDDINLSDTLELSDEPSESGLDIDNDTDFGGETDLSSSLDADLDSMLDDDFQTGTDLGVAASTEGAIGLEDMERALDEMASQPEETELSPDEALAAMWEQSLSEGSDSDVDDIDALLNATQTTDEPETSESETVDVLSEELSPESETDVLDDALNDLDDETTNEALFDKVLDDEPELDLSQDIDLSDDDLDDILNETATASAFDESEEPQSADLDSELSEDSTALLDEFLDDDIDLISDSSLEEADETDLQLDNTDALLDELLDDELLDEDGNPLTSQEGDDTDALSLDPMSDDEDDISDSDALLDELVGDDDIDPLDESALLDEAIDDDDMLSELIGDGSDAEDLDLAGTDVLLDELVSEDDELENDELENDSVLLGEDDLEDEDLLGDDLISIDDGEFDLDKPEEPAATDAELEKALEPEPEPEPEQSQDIEHAEADSDITELEELVAEASDELNLEPPASESDLDLLDDLLEQDDEPEFAQEQAHEQEEVASTNSESDPLDGEEREIPEASQEDIDLLDSLLGEEQEEGADASSDDDDMAALVDDTPAAEAPESESTELETEFSEPAEDVATANDEADLDDALAAIEPFEQASSESASEETESADVEAEELETEDLEASEGDETVTADAAPLDLSSLPEYDEEAALADSDFDEAESDEPVEADLEEASFDLDNLPEYTEEDAAVDFDVAHSAPSDALNKEDIAALDVEDTDVEDTDVENDVDAKLDSDTESATERQETQEEAPSLADEPESSFTATENNTLAFPPVDPISLDDLGEFDEDDALGAALDEQRELDEAVPESDRSQFSQPSAPVSQASYRAAELNEIAELDDDEHQVAGLNMEALLSEPLDDEPMALGDFETETPDTHEAMSAREASDLENALEGDDEFDVHETLDASDEQDIPEDESGIWDAEQTPEPELESEDWSQQPEILGDDIKSMDLDADLEGLLEEAESELVEATSSDDGFISIDELMKDDGLPQEDPDSVKMDLNVGLEDFPDVLNDIQAVDVDSSGEAATNMDLAKAYLEMNDVDGAIQLLEQVMQGDDSNLKEEARMMIEKLH
ncbi:FimV/HubP family polar landmark protein [Enterovibrio sp. 27052020O]|uniref:FimV/HubP family polar landmark protein n=1 Tax=Enterovibrio sp. 27052020O TaxID=3241166 RepID=UPI00388FB98E